MNAYFYTKLGDGLLIKYAVKQSSIYISKYIGMVNLVLREHFWLVIVINKINDIKFMMRI